MPKTIPTGAYGFRLSLVDVVFLIFGIVSSWWLYNKIGHMGFIPIVVVGHFFLFCNIIRLRRNFELFWAVVFLVNFFIAILNYQSFSWLKVLSWQSILTLTLVLIEVRSKRYHGIFSHILNPKLQEYLQDRYLCEN